MSKNGKEKSQQHASSSLYKKTFCEYNLSFFKPKKDQCLTCEKYKKSEKPVPKKSL